MADRESFADIILPVPLKQDFTYRIPAYLVNDISPGKRVVVQFGVRKLITGIVREVHNRKPDRAEIRDIISILDETPVLTPKQINFWDWMADYYMCSTGEVLKSALPAGLKLESESYIIADNAFNLEDIGDKRLKALFSNILRNPGISVKEFLKIRENQNLLGSLRQLIDMGAIRLEEVLRERARIKRVLFVRLKKTQLTAKERDKILIDLSKAPKQSEAMQEIFRLSEIQEGVITRKEIPFTALTRKYGNTTVNSLINKNLIDRISREDLTYNYLTKELALPEKLSQLQQEVLDLINEKFVRKDVVLLHGVTSSGKTEIYIHLIKEVIERGQQVLYLLPEIALTVQIIKRLKRIFGDSTGIYHSRFSDPERIGIYKQTAGKDGKLLKVILGARSAIFLPFRNLGLVIIDEEHETSYKQFDPAPRYNARDAAIKLAMIHGAKVLLGTATPSIESYSNWLSGKYDKVELNERFGQIMLPEILVSDLREARKKRTMISVFSPLLITEIKNALNRGKQVILFQNRRGFSSFVECDECGWIPRCRTCDVSLTYHKYNNSLVCHYCGFSRVIPAACDNCGSKSVVTRGFGTELIEEEISLIFPGVRVSRLDMDTSRQKGSQERIIEDFANQKIDVLVGTQMISKGLDFDDVSVVGIINADQMINYPDFRAYERSFQLMEQVSGRAGRKDIRGKVIIQTSDPGNPLIQHVRNYDYKSMFAEQIRERKLFMYPPFVRMIKISLRHKDISKLEGFSNILKENLKAVFGKRVYGPQAPIVGKISNYHIKDIILKIEKKASFERARKLLREILSETVIKGGFQTGKITIDVDPF